MITELWKIILYIPFVRSSGQQGNFVDISSIGGLEAPSVLDQTSQAMQQDVMEGCNNKNVVICGETLRLQYDQQTATHTLEYCTASQINPSG